MMTRESRLEQAASHALIVAQSQSRRTRPSSEVNWDALCDNLQSAIVHEQHRSSDETRELFDDLSSAMYYGFAFRLTLLNNPKAFDAAQTLVDALTADKNPGLPN